MRSDLAVAVVFAVLAAVIAASAPPASATTACATQVIEDWRDDGAMDRRYALSCYEEAIDALPEELRIYTNAVDVIRQAYLAGGGTRSLAGPRSEVPPAKQGNEPPPQIAPPVNTSATTDVPLPVYVLGALALALLAAGALGYVSRRRSRRGDELPPP